MWSGTNGSGLQLGCGEFVLSVLSFLKYTGLPFNCNHGVPDKDQSASGHPIYRGERCNRRCLGLLLRLLSISLDVRCSRSNGLVALKHGYWNGRAVGTALQFFIEKREREKARAELVPSLMTRRLVTVKVTLNDEQTRSSEGSFWYLKLANMGEEAANQVAPLVNVSSEFEGLVEVPIIGPHFEDEILVKSRLSSEAFDSKRERFALALEADANIAKPSLNIEGLGARAFLLCFAMKCGSQLYVPIRRSPIVLNFPVDVVLRVYSRAKGLPRRYCGAYRCHGNNWHDCKVERAED